MSHKPCCGSKPRPDRRHWREPKPNHQSSLVADPAELETLTEFSYSSEGEIDVDQLTTVAGQHHLKRDWVPSDPVHFPFTGATAWTMKKRPGTVRNPVRSDGSRRPSEFWTYWANIAIHAGTAQTIRTDGGHTTFWRDAGGIDIFYPLSDALYSSAIGNRWSRVDELDSWFPSDVRNRARTKLREKLSETDWDLGVFAGEIRETASMFYDAGQRIALAINRIGRSVGKSRRVVIQTLRKADGKPLRFIKRRKGSKGPLKVAPDSWKDGMFRKWEIAIINDWLLFQYGIIPLLHDIEDIVTFAVESSVDHTTRPRVTLRAGASSDTFSKVRVVLDPYGAIVADLPVMVRTACHYAATYEIGVRPGFVERAGLGNPGSVFWNLARFTMVIDYVVQVGRWLDALVIPSNVDFVEGSESLIQRTVNDGTERVFPISSDSRYVVQKGSTQMTSFKVDFGRFKRSLLSGEGVPPPSYPQVRNAFNLTRVANVLALIANALKG